MQAEIYKYGRERFGPLRINLRHRVNRFCGNRLAGPPLKSSFFIIIFARLFVVVVFSYSSRHFFFLERVFFFLALKVLRRGGPEGS